MQRSKLVVATLLALISLLSGLVGILPIALAQDTNGDPPDQPTKQQHAIYIPLVSDESQAEDAAGNASNQDTRQTTSASAANSRRLRQVISNPFHEYSGIPGLKLGYGDVLAECQAYDNPTNANPYSPFLSNVNVIVSDNYNEGVGVNQGCRTPQNETTIAVNPANPNNLVAGANDYRDCCVVSEGTLRNDGSGWVYVSMDGGTTWTNKKLPGLGSSGNPQGVFKKLTSVGDPTIAFGANNTVYYANIGFNRVDESDGIFVSVSHDGGLNWDKPVLVATSGGSTFFNDKLWVGADPTSGKVTISWTRFKDNPQYGYVESPIVAATSTNYGASWSNWVDVSGRHKYNQGSVPVYGNDGTIYVSFESAVADYDYFDYNVVAKSTDGGKTFTQTVVSRNVDENFPIFGGRGVLTGLHFRTNTFPALTIDRATGKLYMAWADNRNGDPTMFCDPGCAPTSVQVFIQSSTDGVTWSSLQQLTTSTEDKIYPWVAANAGKVIVSYYTREFAGSPSLEIDFAYAKSNDGGTTWSSSTRITEQSSDPGIQFASGAFIGDYTGVVVGSDNVAHPIWTDFRGNPGVTSPNQDAVTDRITLP